MNYDFVFKQDSRVAIVLGALLFLVGAQAMANSAGTDLNLSAKPRAGG